MVVVIGASSALGQELLGGLCRIDQVIATFHTRDVRYKSDRLTKVRLNLADQKAVIRFGKNLVTSQEPLTLIYLAALTLDELVVNSSLKRWQSVFQINVESSFLILKEALPKMVADKWGRVIFVSSCVTRSGDPGTASYSASKSALHGLSRVVSQEYGRFGVTSNVLQLGYFEKGLIDLLKKENKDKVLNRIPSRRWGGSKDIFEAIRFIIRTDYLNGSVIVLDGGLA